MGEMIRIGALISGGGSNLKAIMDACDRGAISGKVVFVGADTPDAGGLKRAEHRGIPVFVVDYARVIRSYRESPDSFTLPSDADYEAVASKQSILLGDTDSEPLTAFLKTRLAAEAALLDKIRAYDFDLLVLAGFMRTLTPYFIDRINDSASLPRIMNIHPALLPAFPGIDGYGDTFRYGCKVGGCTVHFVDYGEDTGPIIGQKAFEIAPKDTIDDVRRKGLSLEWQLYPECIRLWAEGRLRVETNPGGQGRAVVKILSPGENGAMTWFS